MPKARRYTSRASRRKAPYRRRRTAPALKRAIRREVIATAEDKLVCTDHNIQSLVSGTWWSAPMFYLAQGDDVHERDGNVVMGNYAKVRMSLTSPSDRVAFVRLMVIRWKGTKAAFSVAELPTTHLECVTPAMRAHYTVVRDEVISLNPRTTGATEDSRIQFKKMFIKDKNKKVYDATGNITAERGQLYICALHGSNYAGGTDDPEVHAITEYHFKDV